MTHARPVVAVRRAVARAAVVLAAVAGVHGPAAPLGAQRAAADAGIPHLRREGQATQLVVDGRPFLVRGGELGNSTATGADAMARAWPRLRALHLNTVLAPVSWELIEPEEGRYDFRSVDRLLAGARAHDLRLVLLWFGSWKNSMSSYAPTWVKTDQRRFPRTEATRGAGQEILSPFAEANVAADARAFAALMRHLRRVDGARHTVLMVQVENEIGMIPEARDHSATADSLFAAPVPAALLHRLQARRDSLAPELRARWATSGFRTAGSWGAVFGPGLHTDELFMAWHFARYADRVAAAGKREYPLPMFVNAALIRPGYTPGRYVSAGPLPHLVDVWRAGAPSLDLLSPDIYFPNVHEWATRYARTGTPLFVPEARLSPQVAVDALWAVGAHAAIGYSPFAIENADPATAPIGRAYALLASMDSLVLAHQRRGTIAGVMPPIAVDGTVDATPQRVVLGGPYALTVRFADPPGPPVISPGQPGAAAMGGAPAPSAPVAPPAPRGGLIIALGPDDYLVAGTGLVVTFAPADGVGQAGILSVDEGRFVQGRWMPTMRLNGDQTHQGRHLSIATDGFGVQRVRLYRYR